MRFVGRGLLVVASFVTPSIVFAKSTRPDAATRLTVDAAIAEALDQNLTLIATRAGVTRADSNLITAGLRPNPVLSVGGNHLRLHNRYPRSKKEEKQSCQHPTPPTSKPKEQAVWELEFER